MKTPDYMLERFDSEKEWREFAISRGYVVQDAPEKMGHPESTLVARNINGEACGICLPDGTGQFLREFKSVAN